MAPLIFGLEEQFVITFLFVLAVVFGGLRISNVLKSAPAAFLLSIAVAAFASMYTPFTVLLWSIMPSLTWFFIIVFLIAFVFEMFGIRKGQQGPATMEAMVVNAAILLVLLSLGWMIADVFPMEIPFIGGAENLIFLFGLIFIIAIFWGAMKQGFERGQAAPAPQG